MEPGVTKRTVAFRFDANGTVGAGHAMRCVAVAEALQKLGYSTLALVSDSESRDFLVGRMPCAVVGGNPARFNSADSYRMLEQAERARAVALVVDSYGATSEFFSALRQRASSQLSIVYIDDMYTYECGNVQSPIARDVDLLVNYSLFANAGDYQTAYADKGTRLLIGPRYAPLRAEFRAWRDAHSMKAADSISDVLVTTGSTNPDHLLERLATIVAGVVSEDVAIHVVVGPRSRFDSPADRFMLHRGVRDMVPLMELCQFAVSAAGSTLYELAAMGVPALAVAMVDNQIDNMASYENMGMGAGCVAESSDVRLAEMARVLVDDQERRIGAARRSWDTVDARGAERVAREIANLDAL